MGTEINVAVVHGGSSIKEFFKRMKKNKKEYHFVEFMGCTGGCINGGGQPIHPAKVQDNVDIRTLRAESLYAIDAAQEHRKSHLNPIITKIYEEWLEEPGSHKAHELLHTTYTPKKFYK